MIGYNIIFYMFLYFICYLYVTPFMYYIMLLITFVLIILIYKKQLNFHFKNSKFKPILDNFFRKLFYFYFILYTILQQITET